MACLHFFMAFRYFGIELLPGDSSAATSLTEKNPVVSEVKWISLKWNCLTPVAVPSLHVVDLVAADLALSNFNLQEVSAQNLTFTASVGVATTATSGYLSLSSLTSTENGERFKYSIALSLDEILSDDDVRLPLLETKRSFDKIETR